MVGLPPEAPERIRPYTIVALFDVDSAGRVLSFTFNESKDSDYNKQVRLMLRQIRFRPGVTLDGVPIRATARLEFIVF